MDELIQFHLFSEELYSYYDRLFGLRKDLQKLILLIIRHHLENNINVMFVIGYMMNPREIPMEESLQERAGKIFLILGNVPYVE